MAGDDDLVESLPREELRRMLLAVRSVARASGPLDFERVLAAVLAAVRDVLAPDRTAIYLLDEARGKLVYAGSYPPTPNLQARYPEIDLTGTLNGRIVAARKPVCMHVGEIGPAGEPLARLGLEHVGFVPLYVQDRASGVLHLARKGRGFDEHDLRIAQTLGEFLIVYLENARLYTDAHGRLQETAMLLDVSRSVIASLDLGKRLVASAQAFSRLVDASHAFIVLLEANGTELVMTEFDPSWTIDVRGTRIPLNRASAIGVSILERRTIAIEDAESSPMPIRWLIDTFGVKSVLVLPLLLSGEPIGGVIAIETTKVRPWTPTQLQRGELIAHQIAIAIAHARLFDELKKSYDELAHAQQELVKRERLAALGQLAATLAHEVRNPLAVIFNSITTLGKTLPDDPLLGIMREEANRLDRLVRELLDFVRPVMPALEDESLCAIVEETLVAANRELGNESARFTNEVPQSLPLVPLDAEMVRRALLNLVVNAAQASGPSGDVAIRAWIENSILRIEVADTGKGIAQGIVARVFEPFFTTKATGTGLGLAIVKEIVEAHRGEVHLATYEGKGTTVTLLVPVERSESMKPP